MFSSAFKSININLLTGSALVILSCALVYVYLTLSEQIATLETVVSRVQNNMYAYAAYEDEQSNDGCLMYEDAISDGEASEGEASDDEASDDGHGEQEEPVQEEPERIELIDVLNTMVVPIVEPVAKKKRGRPRKVRVTEIATEDEVQDEVQAEVQDDVAIPVE